MSRRPIEEKRKRRLIKSLRVSPPAYIELVDFLVTRGYARTKREARELVASGRVKADSHTLGVDQAVYDLSGKPYLKGWEPRVPASVRNSIVVTSAP